MQFPFLPLGLKWKVVKGVHCPTLLNGTGLMSLSSCWQKLLQNKYIFLDVQFSFLPVGVKWKVVKYVHCPLLLMDTCITSLSFCWRKLLQKYCYFGCEFRFLTTRVNMEGCERCTLSPSIDGHWSHVSICLGMKVITKRMLILDMQFPFFKVGVKWKIVKDVHCPLLLMDTCLTSLSFCWRKLLQK